MPFATFAPDLQELLQSITKKIEDDLDKQLATCEKYHYGRDDICVEVRVRCKRCKCWADPSPLQHDSILDASDSGVLDKPAPSWPDFVSTCTLPPQAAAPLAEVCQESLPIFDADDTMLVLPDPSIPCIDVQDGGETAGNAPEPEPEICVDADAETEDEPIDGEPIRILDVDIWLLVSWFDLLLLI